MLRILSSRILSSSLLISSAAACRRRARRACAPARASHPYQADARRDRRKGRSSSYRLRARPAPDWPPARAGFRGPLFFRMLVQLLAFGGEADAERAVFHSRHVGEDVGILFKLEGHGAAVRLLDL